MGIAMGVLCFMILIGVGGIGGESTNKDIYEILFLLFGINFITQSIDK